MNDETGFSSWVCGEGDAINATHAGLARRFMTSHLTPEQYADRDWRKERTPVIAHGEVIRSRAETRESFAQRIAKRRRQRAEGLASAAD